MTEQEKAEKTYRITYRYKLQGVVEIKASTQKEAIEMLPYSNMSQDQEEVISNFSVHDIRAI